MDRHPLESAYLRQILHDFLQKKGEDVTDDQIVYVRMGRKGGVLFNVFKVRSHKMSYEVHGGNVKPLEQPDLTDL